MNIRTTIILLLILGLAAFLRLYRLGNYPALNSDEAAIGYNAYSLIQTGKDEHGNPWPIHFQSFNDYKPGLYFYLVLPFVKFFGLNVWSVRLPSALLGVTTIFLVYKIVEILRLTRFAQNGKKMENGKWKMEILAAAMLAISPWHIHYARGGWEVNVATFLMVLGTYLFVKGLKNIVPLLLSAFVFSLSLYIYHSARVVVPLLVLGLTTIYWKEIKRNIRSLLLSGLVALVTLLPLVKDFTRPEIVSRAGGVGIFADTGTIERINEQRGEHNNIQGLVPLLLHNKVINYSLVFLKNWASHYHGEFLFLSGDVIQRNRVPETGQMYLFDIIFVIVGTIGAIRVVGKDGKRNKGWLVILWWLIVAPVASALTFQSPHALRAQNMVIPLTIISAYGIVMILSWVKNMEKPIMLLVISCLLLVVIAWQFARYQHIYWVHMAKEYPYSSQYGVKELVDYLKNKQNVYDNIVVTTRYDQPYILFLFYLKYPPEKFQSDHLLTQKDEYGFSTVDHFANFTFKPIDFNQDVVKYQNALIIGTEEEIPNNANIIKEIYGSNGYKYFQIVVN